MASRESHARNVEGAIRRVLLRDWDPIGVRDAPEAQDEYDGYVGGVYRLLAAGAAESDLAEHLTRIEHDAIGFSGNRDRCMDVAARLREIDITGAG